MTLLVPLVGAHFRPPAKAVLSALPAGAPLWLVPEPDNPYDVKAVRVLVQLSEALPAELFGRLREALVGTGWEVEDLAGLEAEPLHLGYVADSDGKAAKGRPGNREIAAAAGGEALPWPAKLAFSAEGTPMVAFGEGRSPSEGE